MPDSPNQASSPLACISSWGMSTKPLKQQVATFCQPISYPLRAGCRSVCSGLGCLSSKVYSVVVVYNFQRWLGKYLINVNIHPIVTAYFCKSCRQNMCLVVCSRAMFSWENNETGREFMYVMRYLALIISVKTCNIPIFIE